MLSALCCGVLFADYGIVDGVATSSVWIGASRNSINFPAGLSLALFRRHMLLNNNVSLGSGNVSGPLDYIKMLQDSIRFDVIGELKFVEDKGSYLSGYLADMSHVLGLGDGYTLSLEDAIDRKNQERLQCVDEKKSADEEFFASLSDFDQKASDIALQKSMLAGSCQEAARISIVANTLQLRTIKQLHAILATKEELLVTNRAMIIRYFPLIEKELLQQLLVLSSQLQTYTTNLDQ